MTVDHHTLYSRLRSSVMNCPRCKSPITQSFDPDSIIACPGCGARLMTRAAALRSQGKLNAVDPTPAPPQKGARSASGSSGATGEATDPSAETPVSPLGSLGHGRPAAPDLSSSTTVPPAPVLRPVGPEEVGSSGDGAAVSLGVLLQEVRLLRVGQEEILELLRGSGGGAGPRPRASGSETGATLQPVRSCRRKTVLLIDDDPETCTAARTELEAADVPVRVATEGNDALRQIAEDKPDVIALELGLEGEMAGKDLVNLIKATMEWVDIPIILWTSTPVTTQKEARLVHGADEVVPKSSGPAALVTRVITVFRRT